MGRRFGGAPSTMAPTIDISHLPPALRDRLLALWQERDRAHRDQAEANQRRIAKIYRDCAVPGATKDGFGPVGLAMDPYWVSYFRREYGEEIFQDPEFVEWLKREGEWFAVPEAATRTQIGFRGRPRNRSGFRGKIIATQPIRTPRPLVTGSEVRNVRFSRTFA